MSLRHNILSSTFIAVVVGGFVTVLVLWPEPTTIEGTLIPLSPSSQAFGTGVTAGSYADCAHAVPRPGARVTVTDPQGHVLGTGTLGRWSHAHSDNQGLFVFTCAMGFQVDGLHSEPRYIIKIAGVSGTYRVPGWPNATIAGEHVRTVGLVNRP